ncbi:hypothetical protein ACTOB_004062 [Actinoplanes oblitus]|uniref:Uncharacterized protein n=1 Tax=Actinoplanes oblitus TaxID=3040509 RepID=A0ABY8WR30_9ACTN|nr:hypothetical protein [Actinoplanes oblitus]WIN00362.1 hypothetical protein ACTOB_004062 [Actinoplanes oblitus]
MGGSSVARRQAELRARVGEHLEPGETCRAAVWVARASGLSLISRISGASQGPLAPAPVGPRGGTAAGLYRCLPEHTSAAALALTEARLLLFLLTEATPSDRTDLAGPASGGPAPAAPASGGPAPDGPAPTAPASSGFAAVTSFDRVKLAVRRLFSRTEAEPLAPLALAWQCQRTALDAAAASDPEGELSLRFTDGSHLSVVAPAMLAIPFATAVSRP